MPCIITTTTTAQLVLAPFFDYFLFYFIVNFYEENALKFNIFCSVGPNCLDLHCAHHLLEGLFNSTKNALSAPNKQYLQILALDTEMKKVHGCEVVGV